MTAGREGRYIHDIFMPTTVHLPPKLILAVDRRARALGVSRNRVIVRALEREVDERAAWRPEFLDALRQVEPEVGAAVDDMATAIRRGRRSKTPPRL